MIIYNGTMNNSNVKVQVQASYDKRLNFTATGLLLIWVLVFIFGIFSLINSVLIFNVPFYFIYVLELGNPFLYIVLIIGFFPSRSISISLINLFKNKRWIEPLKFIKGILIELVIAFIASILIIIFYKGNNFTEFFSLFSSFAFLFSLIFLVLCVYYYRYRYGLHEHLNFRDPSLQGVY